MKKRIEKFLRSVQKGLAMAGGIHDGEVQFDVFETYDRINYYAPDDPEKMRTFGNRLISLGHELRRGVK